MKEQNETRFPGAALLVIPFALMSAWYLNYAFHGWFQQDDFGSIYLYQHSLHTSNLWNFNDFGRFLSRNVYWHFLWQIFGAQAAYYFLFNFLTIAGTTFVIFRTFRATYDRGPVVLRINQCRRGLQLDLLLPAPHSNLLHFPFHGNVL